MEVDKSNIHINTSKHSFVQLSLCYLEGSISQKDEASTHLAAAFIRDALNKDDLCWMAITVMLALSYDEFKSTTDIWWDDHWKFVYTHEL